MDNSKQSRYNDEDKKYIKPSYRQKGSEIRGSLYKGTTAHAFTKKAIGSIPSKFETVLYPQGNEIKKGFGSCGFRFNDHALDNPGPGTYIDPKKITGSSMKLVSESFSKKGYGNGFISTSDRFRIENYYPYQIPGPGTYTQEPLLPITNKKPTDKISNQNAISEKYKRKPSSAFIRHEGRRKIERDKYLLGPGSYNISRSFIDNKSNQSTAAFKNTAIRFSLTKSTCNIPGPGQYNIDGDSLKHGVSQGNLGEKCSANFKESSGAKRVKVNLYDPFENVENEEKVTPGPGQYSEDLYGIFKRSMSGAKVKSSMFATHEILDRFGNKKPELNRGLKNLMPGPGQYHRNELTKNLDLREKSRAGAESVFKSDVPRSWQKKNSGPGPAFYKIGSGIIKGSKNMNPTKG